MNSFFSLLKLTKLLWNSLTPSAVALTLALGLVTYYFKGLHWLALAAASMFSIVFLTRIRSVMGGMATREGFDNSPRNAWQVLAKTLIPTIVAVTGTFLPGLRGIESAFVAAIGGATADSWASEIGPISRSQPRLITNLFRKVRPGTPGGITILGELASLSAALIVTAISFLLGFGRSVPFPSALIWIVSMVLGVHVDSAIGATTEARSFSIAHSLESRRRTETNGCAESLPRHRGIFSHEAANLTACLIAASCALFLSSLVE